MTAKLITTSPPAPPSQDADPFRYGWRDVQQTRPDGSVAWERVALTLEDVLHPQEGDVIPENNLHERERRYVTDVFERRLAGRTDSLVLSDCLIDWGLEGLRDHSPDVAPVLDVTDPQRRRGKFYVAREGTRPFLIVEIVSPDTRVNDVERKVEEYYRVRVPLYVIVDEEWEGAPRRMLAYRYSPQGYQAVALDERGRVLLEGLGIRLGLRDNQVVCWDAVTGEEVGDYTQVTEAYARERQARAAAERREQEHAEARAAAERRAEEEAEARAAAEQRLRDLEAELRRLRGEIPP
jgi:colicin import membrane protein